MNAGALVYCLLDAEGEYTPEGYRLIDRVKVGAYELGLWQGLKHRQSIPTKFYEVSLNAIGRSFDPESQLQRFQGSTSALGRRGEFLRVIATWIRRFGDIYIGSESPEKLRFYHRLFSHYLPRLDIGPPVAEFDECEGVPEYFRISADVPVLESILEDVDVVRYVDQLPSAVDTAIAEATKLFEQKVLQGDVNDDNFGEMAEAVVSEIVNNPQLTSENEVVDIDLFNTVLQNLLVYADQRKPSLGLS